MNKLVLRTSYGIIFILLVFVLLIVSLFHYHLSYNQGSQDHVSFNEFLQSPGHYAGKIDSFMGSYHSSFDKGFRIVYNKNLITVYYDKGHQPPRYGEVLVYGILNEDGSVAAIGVHNYNYNFIIYFLSFIVGIFVVIHFFWEWKLTWRGFNDA